MASVKLTTNLRYKITRKLLEDKFAALEAKNVEDRKNAGLAVYSFKFGTDVAKMNELPQGWLAEVDEVYAQINGTKTRFELPQSVRVPAEFSRYAVLLNIQSGHPLYTGIMEILDTGEQLKRDETKLRDEISSALYSCTTVFKLLQVWPEVRDAVEAVQAGSTLTENLPAVPFKVLNEALGLPKEIVEQAVGV